TQELANSVEFQGITSSCPEIRRVFPVLQSGDCCNAPVKRTSTWAVLGVSFASSGTNLTKETCHMSIQAHLAELERRHQALENEISEALTHPSADDLKVAELNRRKLEVKDEIA